MSDILIGTPNVNFSGRRTDNEFLITPESDVQFNELGQLRLVTDDKKLTQSVGKILLTEQGENVFEEVYGTVLQSFIGSPVVDESTFALIKQTVLDALGILVSVQEDIENTKEKLATIESLGVTFNEDRNNTVKIELIITTEAQQEILTSVVIPITG